MHRPGLPPPDSVWLRYAPVAAGMLAASAVAWLCRPGQIQIRSSANLIFLSIVYPVIVACAAAAPAILIMTAIPRSNRVGIRRTILAIASSAVWFAPAACLAETRSMWALAAAAACAIGLTRLMWLLRTPASATNAESGFRSLFTVGRPTVFEPQLGAALCASALLEASGVASATGSPAEAAALFAAPVAIVTWRATAKDLWRPAGTESTRRSSIRALLLLEAGIVLTGVGLLPRMIAPTVYGGDPHCVPAAPTASDAPRDDGGRYAGSAVEISETHPGVILWPEVEKHAVIVPPLPAMRSSLFDPAHPVPMSIPFFGVYWMFNPPDKRPPKNSVEVRGSPEAKSFHSADGRPLTMEAHQNLGKLIDLSCCSRIEVHVKNADTYARTVSLELTLINSTLPKKPNVLLGTEEVSSRPIWRPGTRQYTQVAEPAREVLAFQIPASAPIQQFDELLIVFRRLPPRVERSAKVGIERFVLVPRGR